MNNKEKRAKDFLNSLGNGKTWWQIEDELLKEKKGEKSQNTRSK